MTEWVVLDVPTTDEAPAIARRFLRDHAYGLSADMVNDAQILVSELVTNALRYGRPAITVRVRTDPPGIGVAVKDRGENMPELPTVAPGPDSRTGRGLLIVDAISHAWGVDTGEDPPGKTVWFELLPT